MFGNIAQFHKVTNFSHLSFPFVEERILANVMNPFTAAVAGGALTQPRRSTAQKTQKSLCGSPTRPNEVQKHRQPETNMEPIHDETEEKKIDRHGKECLIL
ncbi:Hypothetical predicted protein [Paramuricea clavata]|uniref:Uncharacterized protein n=1 Tax=Paramuricea clavata TaxID=317549 RepID=A0A6S7I3F9_PARCT|nr:Hypothetical predicted protein [Paramuricea clavata]